MILVTGAKGQLGSDVSAELKRRNIPHLPSDVDLLDITDKNAVQKFFSENDISAVIHCAAYTAVDKAETEYELCYKINAEGTINLAEECKKKDIKMLYVSTDYVFSGEGTEPFEVDDKKNPQNTYGKSKLMGEEAVKHLVKKHFIVRTSWVFGEKNTNFIHTMLRLSETRDSLTVVCDQVGSPTYSKDLARLLCDIIITDKYGEYHGRNDGFCSWFDLAVETFRIAGKDIRVLPVTSEEYKTAAKRPENSRLSMKAVIDAGFTPLQHWKDAVKEYLGNIL